MSTHQEIDERSLELSRAIVRKIDQDPNRDGLLRARRNCERWLTQNDSRAIRECRSILEKPWEDVRAVLLDESEEGKRLRQSNPFCGVLSPRERWAIYREFREK